MTTWIFVEGLTDRELLNRALEDLKPAHQFKIVVGNGRDAVRPLARRQLLTTHEPVALVVDSNTTDERSVRTQRRELEEYLAWGAAGTPYAVLQFVPEVEVVYFDIPSVLYRIVGKNVDPQIRAAGQLAPHKILAMLTAGRARAYVAPKLKPQDISDLRAHPVIRRLREFVEAPTIS